MLTLTGIYRTLHHLYGSLPYRLSRMGYAFPPLRVSLMVTHRCNLRCEFCVLVRPESKGGYKEELDFFELIETINQIPRFSLVTFTGGEPLLRKDFMDILEKTVKRNRCSIITNGLNLTEEKAREIIRLSPKTVLDKGVTVIGISIHGMKQEHDELTKLSGAFDKIIANIEWMQSYKKAKKLRYPLIDLKCVINKTNAGSLSDIVNLANTLDIDFCSFQIQNMQISSYGVDINDNSIHLIPPPQADLISPNILEEEFRKIHSCKGKVQLRFNPDTPESEIIKYYSTGIDLKDYYCDSLWTTMHITPKGDVVPCYSYKMGNIKEKRIAKIWNGYEFRDFRVQLRNNIIFPGCLGCCVMKWKSNKFNESPRRKV